MVHFDLQNDSQEEGFPYLVWKDLLSASLHPGTQAICLNSSKYLSKENEVKNDRSKSKYQNLKEREKSLSNKKEDKRN